MCSTSRISSTVWAAILGYVCYDLLQGLCLSLNLLWICLYDPNVLIPKATVMIWLNVVEDEAGILVLDERRLLAATLHVVTDIRTYVVRGITISTQAKTGRAYAHLCNRMRTD
jgi:hypothetical protein